MNSQYDAVIIGAGVIGTATAFELAKQGYRTLSVDKLPAAGYGSTGATCAIVRTHYSYLEGTALAYESFLHWKDWPNYLGTEDERGFARLVQTGMVVIKSRRNDFQKHLRHHDALGIEYEEWDIETLQANYPFLDVSEFYPPRRAEDERFGETTGSTIPGAIYIPAAGYVNDPQLSAHNLQRAAEARGAEFQFNMEVVGIGKRGGRVSGVTLKGGQAIAAPVVVNVAGPHSFIVNRMAGVHDAMKLETRALRHEVHYLKRPEGSRIHDSSPFISDDDIGGYSRPEVGEMLMTGSLDPDCDPKDWIDDPDDFNREVTDAQWRSQVYRLALRMPGLRIPNQTKGFADLYDVSDDWMPIYDRSDLDGFYMAVGTSGNQYKNAPMVGLMMAELITACEQGRDHDGDPVHVEGRYTELTFNVGFYFRNREINLDSSYTVLG
jgi:sarcosine oxidase subunit beta